MKIPVLATKKLDSFINAADGGTPSEKPKKRQLEMALISQNAREKRFTKLKKWLIKAVWKCFYFLPLNTQGKTLSLMMIILILWIF